MLYAHGNAFQSFKAAAGLAGCTTLRKLSLHGVPIENMSHYCVKVLALVPTVAVFDFTQVRAASGCDVVKSCVVTPVNTASSFAGF